MTDKVGGLVDDEDVDVFVDDGKKFSHFVEAKMIFIRKAGKQEQILFLISCFPH